MEFDRFASLWRHSGWR